MVSSLNRRQAVSLKVGFLEEFEPPRVGLFGNHQFQYMTRDAFGDVPDDRRGWDVVAARAEDEVRAMEVG